jgi:uncharacterized membrane protein YphA (DoxX/SURF4 family)
LIQKAKKIFHNSLIELLARWLLGLIFIYASYHKIFAPAHFAKIIYGYYLFPDVSINMIAIILPFLELFCGLALILGIYPRSAALIINVMLLTFVVAISINLIRGREFDCGCFSFNEQGYRYSALELLFRDIALFIVGLQVLFFPLHRRLCLLQSGSILNNRFASD